MLFLDNKNNNYSIEEPLHTSDFVFKSKMTNSWMVLSYIINDFRGEMTDILADMRLLVEPVHLLVGSDMIYVTVHPLRVTDVEPRPTAYQ